MVGIVKEARKKTSRNGNNYLFIKLSDEYGQISCRLMDGRQDNMTRYYEGEGRTPKEDEIVIVYGNKSEDSIFLNTLSILNEKIYTKLYDLES